MIVFLDFDGVLHPFSRPEGPLTLLPAFERVMRDFPDVAVVISSAWREVHSLMELRSFFSDDIAARIIDTTPIFLAEDHMFVREAEIIAWLEDNGRQNEEWLALDDTDWFFTPQCSNLILVDSDIGFNRITEAALRRRLPRRG